MVARNAARTPSGRSGDVVTSQELPSLPDDLDPFAVKCRCAELWSHPVARLLAGEAFRPGGVALTEQLVDRLGLAAGARVLDVGCGAGATLDHLRGKGFAPVGVDYAATLLVDAAAYAPVVRADAERLPFVDGRFDAVVSECVVSTLPDKLAALRAAHDALRLGGRLVMSDVTLTDALPEPLGGLASWVACTAGALSLDRYVALLEEAGFRVEHTRDHRGELQALIAQARRRFALLAGAISSGLVDATDPSLLPDGVAPGDPDTILALGRHLLAQVSAATEDGDLGYVAITASAV